MRNRIYIIAEAGVNHNGSLELAKKMVSVAKSAGADAIKFQSFKSESVISQSAPKAKYQLQNTSNNESQLEMVKRLELSSHAHRVLKDFCEKSEIDFLSTPFDLESLELLVGEIKVSRLKIASGDLTNGPLLLQAARSKKPIIMSTGMSTMDEVETALGVLAFGYTTSYAAPSRQAFAESFKSSAGKLALEANVTLLHCTTEYPAPFEEVNLRSMTSIANTFSLPTGLSDHSPGYAVPIGAAALGATVIEKHFTLDKNMDGPDQKASLEPDELAAMIRSVRQVEAAMGSAEKTVSPSEKGNRLIARRSLIAEVDIKRGELFDSRNLAVKRPGTGISPMEYWNWLGKAADREYMADEEIKS